MKIVEGVKIKPRLELEGRQYEAILDTVGGQWISLHVSPTCSVGPWSMPWSRHMNLMKRGLSIWDFMKYGPGVYAFQSWCTDMS